MCSTDFSVVTISVGVFKRYENCGLCRVVHGYVVFVQPIASANKWMLVLCRKRPQPFRAGSKLLSVCGWFGNVCAHP